MENKESKKPIWFWPVIVGVIVAFISFWIGFIAVTSQSNSYNKLLEEKELELETLKREQELKPIKDNKLLIDSLQIEIVKLDGVIVHKDHVIDSIDNVLVSIQEQRDLLKEKYKNEKENFNQIDSTGRPVITGRDSTLFD